MVKVKNMNQNTYASLLRAIKVAGETIRSRQEEKKSLLTEFDAESKRFFFGKISERSLASTSNRVNKELNRLDKEIRRAITNARITSSKVISVTAAQAPIKYRATVSGIYGSEKKPKRKVVKRKPAKKKSVKKKKVKRKNKK